jgi:hypothetical protein
MRQMIVTAILAATDKTANQIKSIRHLKIRDQIFYVLTKTKQNPKTITIGSLSGRGNSFNIK